MLDALNALGVTEDRRLTLMASVERSLERRIRCHLRAAAQRSQALLVRGQDVSAVPCRRAGIGPNSVSSAPAAGYSL